MAETLTYDPTPADQPELNEEEQNSLEVGEKLAEQESELLAGKYKDAQELESAYLELQKKLGSEDKEKPTSEEVKEEVKEEPENKSSTDNDRYKDAYLEDGNVNYATVKEGYGEKLGTIFEDAGLDPFKLDKEFHETKGKISNETKQQLIDSGLSERFVDSYLEGVASQSGYNSTSVEDLTDKEVISITDSVGGEKDYRALMDWSNENVTDAEAEAFDNIVNTGNADAIRLLVTGLKARYDEANGYEGRMLTGKSAQANTDSFRSQAEVVKAMSDPRYENDPAYRQDVYDKLDRSKIKF
jgi:hypothetical protein